MRDYFLHSNCGYTFTKHGTIAGLTQAEERRLWRGLALWNEEVEHSGENSQGVESEQRKAAQRQQATNADKRRFREELATDDPKRN